MKITVRGPAGGRPAAPVAGLFPFHRIDPNKLMGLVEEKTGRCVPVQADSRGRLCWMEQAFEEDEVRTYRFDSRAFLADAPHVAVRLDGDSTDVTEDGKLVLRYNAGAEHVRPFVYPLNTPSGMAVTRDRGANGGPAHLRSCWGGWGDVNGIDHWNIRDGGGRQVHRRYSLCVSGSVFSRLGLLLDWVGPDGARQMCEHRVYTVYTATPGCRIIDVTCRFISPDSPVTFGDTDEGGLCALQMIDELSPKGGGKVFNAEGADTHEECWGASASWCGFSGKVNDTNVCVAMLGCPANFRFPSQWTVTDDGLLAANAFGLGSYLHKKDVDGSRTIAANEAAMFRYRLLICEGHDENADIESMFSCFAKPVVMVVE